MTVERRTSYGDVFQRPRICGFLSRQRRKGTACNRAMRTRFEQIGKPEGDPSGVFRISYGSGRDDPMPFVLTVTLPQVARELGRSVSFAEISKYVEQNADKLKATARFAKIGRGYTAHTLE